MPSGHYYFLSRKFWHCYGGVGQHYACRTDMLFDLRYNGCNYADQTDCGDRWFKDIIRVKQILVERLLFRPICGACDEGCVYQSTTTTASTTAQVSNLSLSQTNNVI